MHGDDDRSEMLARTPTELLRIPGVAGVWTFGRRAGNGDHSGEAPGGDGRPLDAIVTICFLDDDPVSVSGPIGDLMHPLWKKNSIIPDIAGPLEAIVPWSWDWF